MNKEISTPTMTKRRNLGVVFAGVVIFLLSVVSIMLLVQVGQVDTDVREQYLARNYKALKSRELETKFTSMGELAGPALSQLKDLDMPDYHKVQQTYQSVDLFDRVFSQQELCLAQAVYFEARGEPLIGQVAIVEVVLNRMANPRYPNKACEVVFQNKHLKNRCQFSFACDGKSDRPKDLYAWEKSLKVVALVLDGERSGVAKNATHYHASYVSPFWREHFNKVGEIGRHIFYQDTSI
ncbi:cell wall hydrolase [Sneathiella chinensis]|nr:cell wall hydrolase [Sneathiella chinensis]